MKSHLKASALFIAIWLATGSAAAQNAAGDIQQAQTLLQAGRATDAYQLLEKSEFAQAGNPQFDTLLGIAALESGKPDKATLAFERVLAVQPNAIGVRLDMARAYFALGDHVRAKQEFALVIKHEPPPAARIVVDKYLAEIDKRERAKQTAVNAYAEAFIGHDDNITSVVGDFTGAVLATYGLPGYQPTGNAVMRTSPVIGTAAGVDVAHKINENVALYAGADARYRHVTDATAYSSQQLDVRAGISYSSGPDQYRAGVVGQVFRQTTDTPTADRNTFGLTAEWRRNFSERDQGSVSALVLRQQYPDIAVNDVDTLALGIGWLHQFDGDSRPLLYANLLLGQDNALNTTTSGTDYSKRFASLRLYGQLSLTRSLDGFASIGYLYRSDRSLNARSPTIDYGFDRVTDFTLGLAWRPAPNWLVKPQVSHSENRSNVPLSDYKRTEATVTVHYDFQ